MSEIKENKEYWFNGNLRFHYFTQLDDSVNKYHNLNGPAYKYYSSDGYLIEKSYYINGKRLHIKTDEEFEKYVKTLCLK